MYKRSSRKEVEVTEIEVTEINIQYLGYLFIRQDRVVGNTSYGRFCATCATKYCKILYGKLVVIYQ